MNTETEIIFIAAMAKNRTIGLDNTLPWRLKADLAHFKRTTTGHPILMGRKTWESLGRPLPGRRNLVLTRNPQFAAEGAEVFTHPQEAIAAVDAGTVFVIGGAQLYTQMLDRADRLVLTEINADVEGDAHFPHFSKEDFVEVSRETHRADDDNEFDYDFVEYRRRKKEALD